MSKRRFASLAEYLSHVETQQELAARLGITQPTISRALQGFGSFSMFVRISKATGVPLESFAVRDAA
jgi:transcriptional regulator with XRE-family HTH domain